MRIDFTRPFKLAAPLAALALAAGCTTATPYQPLGATRVPGGYTNMPLDQTHWRVSFFGNSLTSRQQVENYLLYRAAELTLQQGYPCFTIVNHDTDRRTTVQVNPYGPYGRGGFYSGWTPYWSLHGPFGWHYYDPWRGGPFFPGSYDVNTIDRYQAMADIALTKECAVTPGTFNAQQVVQNLQRYIVYPAPPRR
jgi:hypothetical protein